MSLFGDYIMEREGISILEDDFGFATYKINEEECYLIDLYVVPEMRSRGYASGLANSVCKFAKNRGCTYLLGSVDSTVQSATESAKVLLAYGMRLHEVQGKMIYFVKDL